MERRILYLTSIAHFFTHLLMLVYPTIAVVQAEQWGVDVADLLILTFPGFLLYGLGAVPVGIIADKTGGWFLLSVGLIGMSLGALLCAVAESRLGIAVGLGVIGLFASAYHPAGMGLITHGIERSAWALGVNGIFGSAAVAVAPGLAEVLSEQMGWRQAFVALAVLPLLAGIASAFVRVDGLPLPSNEPRTQSTTTVRDLFTPTFILLCIAMTLNGIAYRGNTVVLPTLMDSRVSFLGHGMATSVTYGFAMLMNYVAGHLTERYSAPRIYLLFVAISLPPLIATAWLSGLPLLVVATIYGACALGLQPAENTFVADLSPPHLRSTAYGIKFILTFGVGALAAPLVSQLLIHTSLTTVQLTLSAVVGAFLLSTLMLHIKTKNSTA